MIRIYHTSDLHDRRGIVQPLLDMRRREPGMLFDCGDSLRGSQTVYHRDEPIVRELDAAGYDAQAVGNREFHYLFGLLRLRASRMNHPLVCSNLVDVKGRELPFERFHLVEYRDEDGTAVRVHVAALLVMQYPTGSPWERVFGWRFLDPVTVAREYAATIPAHDMFVVLSHIGLRRDRELARAVGRIDLLLGGHSHDTLMQPAIENGVPIVHAGPYGRYVSKSDLSRDPQSGRWKLGAFSLAPLLGAA